jgi:uncharacterized surface protein with fasciclin (FAS1) repeats
MGPVGRPRKAADPAVKTKPVTAAVAAQADLSSFAAVLKFVGADDELAAATDADIIVYAPTNAALDAFAKEMTGNANATAKDLLQPQYMPLLTHVVASHVTEDDDDDGVYKSFGGQALLAADAEDDDDKKGPKYEGTVTTLPSKKVTANILREEDLGEAGDLYVIDRVLKPDDVFATPTEAFKADPELATFGRLAKALAPELVQRADAGAPGTAFIPTTAAFNKFLAAANLTEAKILANPDLKATVTGTLVYHVVPGVGLDTDSLADSDWTLKTALVVGPEPRSSSDKLTAADVVKTLKVAKVAKAGEAPVVQADLSKAKVTSQVYAGSEVLHKVDAVLVPAVGAPGQANKSMTPPQVKPPAAAVAAAVKTVAPAVAASGRKLMRATARNNIAMNTQRSNIRRAMNGSMSVAQATNLNSRVAALAPIGRVPNYFLTAGSVNRRGGFLV